MGQSELGVIGVIMGGPSAERDISLKSGHAVMTALQSCQHRVVPIVLESHEVSQEAIVQRLRAAQCDVVFIALHGTFGEDGTLQRYLEAWHMPYTGSNELASRMAFDKWAARQRLLGVGVTMPPAIRLTHTDARSMLNTAPQLHRGQFPKPIVVKPIHQGSSYGVSIVETPAALASAIQTALQFDEEVLLEHYICGAELTVAIFDEQALPVIEIRPRAAPFFDLSSKYEAGATDYIIPAPLDQLTTLRVQQAALATHRALGCRHFSRVDLILGEDETIYVLELNTIPGFTELSLLPMAAQACQCNFAELCEHMVALALESQPAMVD